MAQLRFLPVLIAMFTVLLILGSGCAGGTPPQPPASIRTLPTTRPVTTLPATTPPALTLPTTSLTTVATPAWTPGTVAQAGSAILIQGDVVGYKSSRGNFIDEIRFDVVLAPRAEPVTFDVPNTQIIFTKQGTPPYGVNYFPISGDVNGDRVLREGETFRVSIPFTSDAPQYAIFAGQTFTMTIKNPPQPQVLVTASAPPVLGDQPMVLARVPY
jgi:hypothetical protein